MCRNGVFKHALVAVIILVGVGFGALFLQGTLEMGGEAAGFEETVTRAQFSRMVVLGV